jgi:hypothetical protein
MEDSQITDSAVGNVAVNEKITMESVKTALYTENPNEEFKKLRIHNFQNLNRKKMKKENGDDAIKCLIREKALILQMKFVLGLMMIRLRMFY